MSSDRVDINNIPTNFIMPETYSIPIGGGTIIKKKKNEKIKIGPKSVGYKLLQESQVFGGNIITFTDIAVSQYNINIGNSTLLSNETKEISEQGFFFF